MPTRRGAGHAVEAARPALSTIDTNAAAPLPVAANKKANKTALLDDLKVKEEENKVLRSKTSELEDQLAALTEKLQKVQLNNKKDQTQIKAVVPSKALQVPTPPMIPAPRRYTTGYVHFCNENREKVRQSNEPVAHTEVMRILGQMWKALDPKSEEAAYYERLAKEDKARYEKEMEAYRGKMSKFEEERKAIEYYNQQLKTQIALELYDDAMKGKTTITAPAVSTEKKDKETPKKPLTAFMVFQAEKRKDFRAKNPQADMVEVNKAISEEWLKVQKRKNGTKKYLAAADADKQRYEKEMVEYESKREAEKLVEINRAKEEYETQRQKALSAYRQKVESETAVSMYKKNMKEEREKVREEKQKIKEEKQKRKEEKQNLPKRNMTAFFFFSKEVREHVKQEMAKRNNNVVPSVTEVSVELGKLWAQIPDTQKERYHALAAQDKARYDAEMASIKDSQA